MATYVNSRLINTKADLEIIEKLKARIRIHDGVGQTIIDSVDEVRDMLELFETTKTDFGHTIDYDYRATFDRAHNELIRLDALMRS